MGPGENYETPTARRVLVTGAAGRIGSTFARACAERYRLRLMVQRAEDAVAGKLSEFGEVVEADLADLPRLREICRGVDTVLHLAGNASANATWDGLLHANIIGTYNICAAARAAGCRRLIFASSIHAVSGYPLGLQIRASDPVNPGDLYGVSKCFGEALGRYLAEQEDLSVIAIRIGGFQSLENARHADYGWMVDCWTSPRDLMQLFVRSIEVENVRFAILHGVSDNQFNRLDLAETKALVGYEPDDDAVRENPLLAEWTRTGRLRTHALQSGDQLSGLRDDLPG